MHVLMLYDNQIYLSHTHLKVFRSSGSRESEAEASYARVARRVELYM
jgi:hypothetical protein